MRCLYFQTCAISHYLWGNIGYWKTILEIIFKTMCFIYQTANGEISNIFGVGQPSQNHLIPDILNYLLGLYTVILFYICDKPGTHLHTHTRWKSLFHSRSDCINFCGLNCLVLILNCIVWKLNYLHRRWVCEIVLFRNVDDE